MTSNLSRLHITPLSPDLLPIILGRALQSAHDISYHQIQSAPEDSYGYVNLPKMEADRVKQKLNGATLKGKKIKIEDAKPRKRKHEEMDPSAGPESNSAKARKGKKDRTPKAKGNLVQGHELSGDRKVKRGWTEAKTGKAEKKSDRKSDRQKSKYTNQEELLFRTKVPLNKSDAMPDESKKRQKHGDSQLVHEFAKTIARPSFIKQNADKGHGELEFVDGKGWVDEQGTVVEPEPPNVRTKRQGKQKSGKAKLVKPNMHQPTSSTNTTDEPTSTANKASEQETLPDADETTSSDGADAETSDSSSAPSTPEPEDDTIVEQTNSLELHPLEALFKKPQKPASSQDIAKPSLELTTSNFSFFEGGADDDIEEELSVPGTPYSSQDIRNRGLRSAAPTPDTAYPSRFNSYGSSSFHGDDASDKSEEDKGRPQEASESNEASLQIPGKGEPSDFEKMFWEKRGDNNRAWKARRRTVLKEKRQRENRARRPRNW